MQLNNTTQSKTYIPNYSAFYNKKEIRKKTDCPPQLSFKGKAENLANKVPESILKSKLLHKVLELAEKNPSLFDAGFVLLITSTLRPATILAVPGAKKEDKQYAAAKSIATGIICFGLALVLYSPMAKAIQKLGQTALKNAQKDKGFPYKIDSPEYDAFNYYLNYGSKLVIGPIQAILLLKFVPKVVDQIFPNRKSKKINSFQSSLTLGLNNSQYNTFRKFHKEPARKTS